MSRALIILNLPEHWSDNTVVALAERLRDNELPSAVGVDVLRNGGQETLREVNDDE